MKNNIQESYTSVWKDKILEQLLKEGYGTFAKRFKIYNFVIADMYRGQYVRTAMMISGRGIKDIVINPGFFDLELAANGDEKQLMEQLSVIVRHEILHFLLKHHRRLADHLEKKYPDLKNRIKSMTVQQTANIAADYELSQKMSPDDLERIRLMQLNGQVIGGLIAEDRDPSWKTKTMEEIFDILYNEDPSKFMPKTKINVHKADHTQEYKDMYNKIIHIFKDKQYTDDDLNKILSDLKLDADDIVDPRTGEILLDKGN